MPNENRKEASYEQQLAAKQKRLEDVLRNYKGRKECSIMVEPIIGMEQPYHYRKTVHAVFGHNKQGVFCGTKDPVTNRVIPSEGSPLDDEQAAAVICSVRDLLKSFKIKTYDEKSGFGLLRYVWVRRAVYTGEMMVVLVLSSMILPSKNNFVKALRKLHPEIETIIINENYKKTKQILGEKEQIIFGKGFLKDTLCGKEFRISDKSLYPVNPVQAERLYETAVTFAGLTGKETVIDAYCGIGTIGILVSGRVKKVLSVEQNPQAVRDALANGKRNQVKNIDYYTKDAGEWMAQIATSKSLAVDVVFMDPPKAGADDAFLEAMVLIQPAKIIYIMRQVMDTERELTYLTTHGYRIKRAAAVDTQPFAGRMEAVCLLVREIR